MKASKDNLEKALDAMSDVTPTGSGPSDFPGDRPPLRAVPENGRLAADPNLIVSITDFLAGFVPPDYLLDGILQRRFVYSLTAQTGHGKTALALLIARLVGGSKPNDALGKHAAEKGRVVYFAGENPDDLRMRVIGDEFLHNDSGARISFIPGTFSIEAMRARIEVEMVQLGGVDLIIVDTSAAYFLGKDELSNTEMGTPCPAAAHAYNASRRPLRPRPMSSHQARHRAIATATARRRGLPSRGRRQYHALEARRYPS